jgi:hypothetical protein
VGDFAAFRGLFKENARDVFCSAQRFGKCERNQALGCVGGGAVNRRHLFSTIGFGCSESQAPWRGGEFRLEHGYHAKAMCSWPVAHVGHGARRLKACTREVGSPAVPTSGDCKIE